MIANKNIEKLENSAVRLSVTVGKDAAWKEYRDLLNKYARDAQIKGFRKGKVPPALLEKKFGEGIRQEAVGNIIDTSLKEAFETVDEKPLAFAQPELEEYPELKEGEDLVYKVKYDVYPEIKLGKYKGLKAEEGQVTISKDDLKRELEAIQEQNAITMDKADKTVADKNIVTINYSELDDEGNEIADSGREDFVFTIGSGYNTYKLDEDLIGMKVDEEKVIEKSYPEDEENKTLAGTTKKLKVKVTAVKEKQLPEIDDELAQDVDDKFETLADLEKDIKKRLKESAEAKIKQDTIQSLLDQIVEASSIDLPESMIQAELENSWRSFLQQTRMPEETVLQMLKIQGKTKEEMMSEWRDDAVKSLMQRLLVNKMSEEEKIEVSEKEVEKEIKEQAEKSHMPFEDAQKYFKDNGLTEYLESEIKDKKLYDLLIEQAEVTKGKKVKYLDLMGSN